MKIIVVGKIGLSTPAELEVQPQDAVGTVKNKACITQGITDPDSCSLSYKGTVMDDGKRLKEYHVKEGSTLELVPFHREVGSSSFSFSYSPPLYTNQNSRQNLPPELQARIAQEAKIIWTKGLDIKMDVNNPLHWTANVVGVGKWKGRTYTVEIYLSKHYPRAVPKIKFISPINHPNIFLASDGWICLSTFDREIWRPTYNLSTIYESIQYIMKKPNYHRENRWNPAQHNNNYRGTMPEFERALRLRGARRTF